MVLSMCTTVVGDSGGGTTMASHGSRHSCHLQIFSPSMVPAGLAAGCCSLPLSPVLCYYWEKRADMSLGTNECIFLLTKMNVCVLSG
jgi:hypothetical protein